MAYTLGFCLLAYALLAVACSLGFDTLFFGFGPLVLCDVCLVNRGVGRFYGFVSPADRSIYSRRKLSKSSCSLFLCCHTCFLVGFSRFLVGYTFNFALRALCLRCLTCSFTLRTLLFCALAECFALHAHILACLDGCFRFSYRSNGSVGIGDKLDDGRSCGYRRKDNKRSVYSKAFNLHIHATLVCIISVIASIDVGVAIGCVVLKHGIAACVIVHDGELLILIASPVGTLRYARHLQGVSA